MNSGRMTGTLHRSPCAETGSWREGYRRRLGDWAACVWPVCARACVCVVVVVTHGMSHVTHHSNALAHVCRKPPIATTTSNHICPPQQTRDPPRRRRTWTDSFAWRKRWGLGRKRGRNNLLRKAILTGSHAQMVRNPRPRCPPQMYHATRVQCVSQFVPVRAPPRSSPSVATPRHESMPL